MESSQCLVNRAHKRLDNHDGSAINSISVCGFSDLLASGSEDGAICIQR